jgi:hypothetical protein
MSMTIRQRIMAVFRNQVPDQIPVSIYNRYHRSGEVERLARNNGLGILFFDPPVSLLAPPWHLQAGYLSEVTGCSFSMHMDWYQGNLVETRTYETPPGCISQQIVKDPSFGSDWIKKHYVQSIQDYQVMCHIVENTVFVPRKEAIAQRIKDLGEDGVVLGRIDRVPYQKLLIELTGPERLFLDLADHPGQVNELIDVMETRMEEQFRLALESDAEVIWQPDNVTSDMTPPSYFRKYCLPIYQKRGLACREAGKVYAVHMDGRLAGIKQLIAQTPIDVIESFSLAEMAGDVSVEETALCWPGKVICPNFPASLAEHAPAEIAAYIEKLKASFAGRPFMLQFSEDIPISSYEKVLPVLCKSMAPITLPGSV